MCLRTIIVQGSLRYQLDLKPICRQKGLNTTMSYLDASQIGTVEINWSVRSKTGTNQKIVHALNIILKFKQIKSTNHLQTFVNIVSLFNVNAFLDAFLILIRIFRTAQFLWRHSFNETIFIQYVQNLLQLHIRTDRIYRICFGIFHSLAINRKCSLCVKYIACYACICIIVSP